MKPGRSIHAMFGFIMRHPSNRASLPVLLAAVLAAAGVFSICWAPQGLSYSSLEKRYGVKTAQIKRAKTGLAVEDAYKNVSQEVSVLEKKLSFAGTDGELSAGINVLAGSSGLKLSMEDSGSQKETIQGYDITVQEITVSGRYAGLRAFLSGLENFYTVTAIIKIKIEKDDRNPGMVKADIQLAIYKKSAGRAGAI